MAVPPGGQPPSTGRHETRNARNDRPLTGAAARARILHWGFIAGGLVTISDLASAAYANATSAGTTDDLGLTLGLFISMGLYWFAGMMVARETGSISFGVLGGALAGAVDGLVVGTVAAIQVSSMADGAPLEAFLGSLWLNLTVAMISGAAGAWLSTMTPQRPR